MKRLTYLILFSSFLFVTSCAKKIEDVNPDYFGFWGNIEEDESKSFDINKGVSVYMNYEGSTPSSVTGKARVKKNETKLKIGLKGFTIDTPPYQNSDGDYFMVVEGGTYVRY